MLFETHKNIFCHKISMVDQSCPLVCVLIAIILGYVMVLSNVIWQRKLWHHMTKFGQTFTVSTNPDPGVCWNIGRGMLKQNKQYVLKKLQWLFIWLLSGFYQLSLIYHTILSHFCWTHGCLLTLKSEVMIARVMVCGWFFSTIVGMS